MQSVIIIVLFIHIGFHLPYSGYYSMVLSDIVLLLQYKSD